jgi:hypothetical protein
MGCPEATQIAYEVSVAAQNPKLSPHAVEILRAFAATLVFLDDEMSEEARQGR